MEKITVTIDLKEKVVDGLKKIITGFAKAADSAHDFQQSIKKHHQQQNNWKVYAQK